jgi:hypothetical protein
MLPTLLAMNRMSRNRQHSTMPERVAASYCLSLRRQDARLVALLRFRLGCGGFEEELVEGIRISWIYEAIPHAVTCPVVFCNEPSNVSGE